MNQLMVIQAFDLRAAVFIVFVIVSVISWIVNQLNAAKGQPPARPQNRPGPRAQNPQIQREIDRFLREAAGQKPRPEVKVEEIEIVQSQRERRPPAKRKVVERPRPAGAAAPPPSTTRPGQSFAARHLAPAAQSAVAAEHLPLSRMSSEHRRDDVTKSVTEHLGVFAAQQATAGQAAEHRRRQIADLVADLRSRQGMRSAIVMQEILRRPIALRRRTH